MRHRPSGTRPRQPAPPHACGRPGVLALVMAAGLSFAAITLAPGPVAAQPERAAAQPVSPKKADARPADEQLPITAITLYRSGVGSFERRGQVVGDADVQLRFATDQINDILKSMVLLDLGKGQIEPVRYASKEPLERRLAAFVVNIGDNPSAGELLKRLRGTAVKLTTSEGEIAGTILNVEQRPTVLGGGRETIESVHDLPWINLITSAGVRSVNLTRVTGFQLLDPKLAEELGKALAAIDEQRADRIKAVDLSFRGQGARDIAVAYVHEMPIWKASYRLVLTDPADKSGKDAAGQPTIQGWAIVENTTDEDWKDVTLSLVAGRPVSFRMDLYEPLHVIRPEIPVPQVPGVAPRVYQGGVAGTTPGELAMDASEGGRTFRSRSVDMDARAAAGQAPGSPAMSTAARKSVAHRELSPEDMTKYAAQAQAQAGEVGEVFQYRLKNPISLERQRSAMLPILSSGVDGRRVSIYSRGDGSEHPMRGVELKNTSGMQLMPGPIAVYDGPIYAGDAQVGHVPINDKRLISYSLDLDVTAEAKDDFNSTVSRLHIIDGVIEQISKQVSKATYSFTNKDAKRGRTILVEHAKTPGWTLVEPKKPAEETPALYRFEVSVKPTEAGAVSVQQERTDYTRIALVSFDLPTLVAYAQQGKASQAVVDAVRQAGKLQGEINDAEAKINQLESQRNEIMQDQARLRQNMGSVGRETELYKRYATKLNDQENDLERIAKETAALRDAANKLKAQLAAFLRGLKVE